MKAINKSILILAVSALAACSSKEPVQLEPIIITQTEVIAQPAAAPEGVLKYCWEEPIAEVEKVRPGVDFRGEYYRPAHNAVRKVRAGKWRPCASSKEPGLRRNL